MTETTVALHKTENELPEPFELVNLLLQPNPEKYPENEWGTGEWFVGFVDGTEEWFVNYEESGYEPEEDNIVSCRPDKVTIWRKRLEKEIAVVGKCDFLPSKI